MPEGMSWDDVHRTIRSASAVVPTSTPPVTPSGFSGPPQAHAAAWSSSSSKSSQGEVFAPGSAAMPRPFGRIVRPTPCSKSSQAMVLVPNSPLAPHHSLRTVRPTPCSKPNQAQVSSVSTAANTARTSLCSATCTPLAPATPTPWRIGAETGQYPAVPTSNASAPRAAVRLARPTCTRSGYPQPQVRSALLVPSAVGPRIPFTHSARLSPGLIASGPQLHGQQSPKVAFCATGFPPYVRTGTTRLVARR
mmetsp:Transcript_35972/g.82218  ORF Transcript_35972/g.82218 Transcript_35972/m.82218 type:complete len:249 (+) Transcript_35972:136-882(+)